MSPSTREERQQLPEGWRWVKLGGVCRLAGGSTPDTGTSGYWDGNIVWVTPTDLGKLLGTTITTTARRITETGLQNCASEILPKGTVVMSSRAPIGHLAIAGVPLCTNQGCKSFVPGPDVDTVFLYWILKLSVPEIQALGSGATFAEVSKSALQQFEIPFPPLSEQRRIAAILQEQMAAVEKARAAALARLQAVRDLPNAFLRQVFPQPGQALPEGWKWAELGRVCEKITDGTHRSPPNGNAGIPYITAKNIKRFAIDLTELTFVSLEDHKAIFARCDPRPGDVLYIKDGATMGVAAENTLDFSFSMLSSVAMIRPKAGTLDPGFLTAWLNHPETLRGVTEAQLGSAIQRMILSQITRMNIPLPPLPEQQRIAAQLKEQMDSADRARVAAEDELNTINSLPAALLRRAFSGEI
ncbi:MAG: restriction endonuclease subunit S [Candidatus Brocadiia bacterium]